MIIYLFFFIYAHPPPIIDFFLEERQRTVKSELLCMYYAILSLSIHLEELNSHLFMIQLNSHEHIVTYSKYIHQSH